MTVDEAIRVAIAEALRTEAPAILAELAGRSRMISIRELPVSYRLILASEKAGEIRIYRRGNFSAVDEAEFYDWMKNSPVAKAKVSTEPQDEIDELIAFNERRRGTRKWAPRKGARGQT